LFHHYPELHNNRSLITAGVLGASESSELRGSKTNKCISIHLSRTDKKEWGSGQGPGIDANERMAEAISETMYEVELLKLIMDVDKRALYELSW